MCYGAESMHYRATWAENVVVRDRQTDRQTEPQRDTVKTAPARGYYPHTHAYRFNGHLPAESQLARCPFSFPSPFSPILCILPGKTKSLHIFLDNIPPWLPRTSPWFSSFQFHRCTTFNPVSIIFAFDVSKPSQSTFLHHCPHYLPHYLDMSRDTVHANSRR